MDTGVGGECEEETGGWASALCEAYYTARTGSAQSCSVYHSGAGGFRFGDSFVVTGACQGDTQIPAA